MAFLKIFNILGQEMRTSMDPEQKAGWHVANRDGRDEKGWEATGDFYLCYLRLGRICV
jgi:hypothetical protein